MAWYAQLIIYLISIASSFLALWQIDFNKFIRVGRKQYAILVYILLSLAVGAMIGLMFVSIGNAISAALPS